MNNQYPDWTFAAALAALPLQTPHRLRRLLSHDTAPHVWDMVHRGEQPVGGIADHVWRAWAQVASSHVVQVAEACIEHSITVVTMHDAAYPSVLRGDPQAPAVLFMRGDVAVLEHRRVGIIGTRHATQRGKYFARKLGTELALNDVSVVSGLARGIDVESHVGAMSMGRDEGCGPIAVVASGLDVVYPPEHERIWKQVGRRGLLLSEAPPGTPPEVHRFPMRNRILAALSEVLVVVESRAKGGSMITVREAMKRDITVMAVPGAPGIPPCEGTNNLLRDGCAPVADVTDVMIALGLDTRHQRDFNDPRAPLVGAEQSLIAMMGRAPRSIDEIALLCAAPVVNIALLLGRLEEKGWVAQSDGWWEALVA